MIVLDHVSKQYGTGETAVHALRKISLQVEKGAFLSIVGQSGSGKSTLMSILGCLDVPTSGVYRLMGEDVGKLSANCRAQIRSERIGFIFQSFHLAPRLTALENVELPLKFRGMDAKRRTALALAALETVGLSERIGHRPCELSGGQQQRVAVARALASSPPIILADEPTGNLDARSGRAVLDLLQAMHQQGRTILLITHDPSVASLAQRMMTMDDGVLYEC